eukprot:903490-Prorocentrum_minimum.AAC.2
MGILGSNRRSIQRQSGEMTVKGVEVLKEGSAAAVKHGGKAAKQVWGMAESTGKQLWSELVTRTKSSDSSNGGGSSTK